MVAPTTWTAPPVAELDCPTSGPERPLLQGLLDWHRSLRFAYLHLISEYGQHDGHADLVRERIDGVRATR